ncbi:MAG: PrsW family glutamic-type intramembrane protease [Eubacteriales bacterium]|nr:PrsW family glutamic-type intramembrane protease [Eubacteriales bacterium]
MLTLAFMALLPPIVLLVYVYKKDKVEKEPKRLVVKTFLLGIFSIIPTIIVEELLTKLLNPWTPQHSLIGLAIHTFIGIAIVEEFFKMMACKISVWKNKEFNYTFDGVVYAVAAALGFAALENLMYVFEFGMGNAIARAFMSIPGHAIFGVFMGINLGLAKLYETNGQRGKARAFKVRALIIPTILHGLYDFMCSSGDAILVLAFFVFIIALDITAIRRINGFERMDRPIFHETEM